MIRRYGRRMVLGAAALGLSGELLAACGAQPGHKTDPSPRVAPQCVDLGQHKFVRGGRFCEAVPSGNQESSVSPLDHHGPLGVTAETLTSYYIDAVIEWDIATGEPMRLLAPKRSDSWLYAHRGAWTVNPRCDATLVAHQGGCAVAELTGHASSGQSGTSPDGIQGLCWTNDDQLVSLGADDTLRSWRVDEATQTAQTKIVTPAGNRTLGPGWQADTLLVSHSGGVEIFDAHTLQSLHTHAGPPTTNGWQAMGDGVLLGISADDVGMMIWDTVTGHHQLIPTGDPPRAVAAASTGLVAAVDGPVLVVHRPDTGTEEIRLADPSYQTGAAVFSSDGALLHILDKHTGLRTVDVTTGHTITTYRNPAPL